MSESFMPKSPVVCVDCITYNHAPYIIDALNGFTMQQTTFLYTPLVIDDASTDGEQEVILKYIHEECDEANAKETNTELARIIEVFHKSNENCQFVFVLLNKNLWTQSELKNSIVSPWREAAKYIAFCEGDDYWTDPNKLQRQVDFLDENTDYVAVAENAEVLRVESGEMFKMTHLKNMDITVEQIITNQRFIPTASVLCRTKTLDQEYQKLKYKMDTITWCYLASKGKFKFFNIVSSVYRSGSQGITVGTEPLLWANIMREYLLCIKENFGQYVKSGQFNYNIYRQYLYAANKYVDKDSLGIKYWTCVVKAIRYKPFPALRNIGVYLLLNLKKRIWSK